MARPKKNGTYLNVCIEMERIIIHFCIEQLHQEKLREYNHLMMSDL